MYSSFNKPFNESFCRSNKGEKGLDMVSMVDTATNEYQTIPDHVGHSSSVWQGQIRIA